MGTPKEIWLVEGQGKVSYRRENSTGKVFLDSDYQPALWQSQISEQQFKISNPNSVAINASDHL